MLYLNFSYSDEDKQCSYSVVNLGPTALSGSVKSGKYVLHCHITYSSISNIYKYILIYYTYLLYMIFIICYNII